MFPTDWDVQVPHSATDRKTVTKEIPNYLRLHVEEPGESKQLAIQETSEMVELRHAFREVTGWSLHFERSLDVFRDDIDGPQSELSDTIAFHLQPVTDDSNEPPVELNKARELASSLADLLGDLQTARTAICHREAELAAGVPVTAHANEEQHLAARLEAVLKGGAQAVGGHAAAVYLLDDATTELKLRACWGLPKQRLLEPPRPLRGAVADLEALVGHAVVLEDTSILPNWKVPEPFPAAVCVPISSPTEPLGTLWVFCQEPRDFTAEQTNLIEIIAGRVASELQRAVLLSECVQTKRMDQQVLRAVQWQNERLPSITPLLEDWALAGWAGSEEVLSGGFYDWFVPPDGSLAIAMGRAEGSMLEAALTSAAVHGAVRAHCNYPHDAAQMVNRVNETVWNSSAGGQFASLFYAQIQPDLGEVVCCSAGTLDALVLTPTDVQCIESESAPLGTHPGDVYRSHRCLLNPGDTLVILSVATADSSEEAARRVRRERFANFLENHLRANPAELVGAIGEMLAVFDDPGAAGRPMALVVQRK
jgi:serine phosphatase RsbU (regulator of sigma subunit)